MTEEIERLLAELAAERENNKSLNKHLTRARGNTQTMKAERDELRAKCDELENDASELGFLADARCAEKGIVEDQLRAVRHARLRLRVALELIADTDPDEGTAWFHSVANAALKGDDRDALRAKLGASEEVNMMMSGEREEIITERDAAIARAKKAEGLLLDAYNTWGEWPQETLARIDALLNKGDGEK